MASSSDSNAICAPGDLVVKLVKLEDQLGLTRWTTNAEVKKEADYEDDDLTQVDDNGMEWVPVKAEPLDAVVDIDEDTLGYSPPTKDQDETEDCANDITQPAECVKKECAQGSYDYPLYVEDQGETEDCTKDTAICSRYAEEEMDDCVEEHTEVVVTSRLDAEKEEADCQVVNSGVSGSGVNTSELLSSVVSQALTMLVDGAVPQFALSSPQQSSGDNAVCSADGMTRVNRPVTSPEACIVDSTTATSPHIVVDNTPPHHSPRIIVDSSPHHPSSPVPSPHSTHMRVTSTQGIKRLKPKSPRKQKGKARSKAKSGSVWDASLPEVNFLGVGSLTVQLGGDGCVVMKDSLDLMDISSSQLTPLDDRTVQGLEQTVAASTSSSLSRTKRTPKPADGHAKKKTAKKAKKETQKESAARRKTNKKKKKTTQSDSSDSDSESKPSDAEYFVPESKEKGMFSMHPAMGRRITRENRPTFNLFQLSAVLQTEEQAVEFGQRYRQLPQCRFCPLCGQRLNKLYKISRQRKKPLFRFQCNKQPCKQGKNQVQLKWGTRFVSSNLSVRKAILLDYCFVKKYDIPTARSESALPERDGSDRLVTTSTETVVHYYNSCREICAFSIMKLPPIGGLGYTVEVFESFFVGSKSHNEGGSKSHKVHAFQGKYVVTGICIENNDVLFGVSPDLDSKNIMPLIQSKVLLGTHIRTSSCEAYKNLKKFGYEHTIVKDTELFVHNDLNFSGCSNTSQAGTKRPLNFHRRSGTFNLHLAEYLWRRKHRESSDLYLTYLDTVALVYPLPVGDPTQRTDEDVDKA